MAKRYNHSIPEQGFTIEQSGDEAAGIHLICESGSAEIHIEWEGQSTEIFVLPARRQWTSLPLLRTGLKRVRVLPDPANSTPLPVVSYDIGANAGTLTMGAGIGDVGSVDATHPGDGSWTAAPNAGAEDTVTFTFTVTGFTVYVQTAAVEIRTSFDGGTNHTGWIVLSPGVHVFDEWSATEIEVREDVDDAGAEYQVVGVA